MLVVISPAKKLNSSLSIDSVPTKPIFSKNATELALVAKRLTLKELKNLMGLSDNLAELNSARFASFGKQTSLPAAFTFAGDTYKGLNINTLNKSDIEWAQNHLRIISGLYGLLRPLDNIEPYRLEMGSKLKTEQGNNLYEYWNKKIALAINKLSDETNSKILVNCASQEYFHAVDMASLKPKVITPIFMENKNGENKIISFYAKKARGLMARYIIENRVRKIEDLKEFNFENYKYRKELSTETNLIFLR